MKTKKENIKQDFIKEYNEIIGKKTDTISNTEWKKQGDFFEKFSLYKNYTPVETSGHTTLIS